jgi:hypothetical protein
MNIDSIIFRQALIKLAKKHNVSSGKWLIAVPWTEADEVWQKLVNGLLDGKFPDVLGVTFIKIFSRSNPDTNPFYVQNGTIVDNSMMSVATQDWTNKEKTMDVSKVIRGLGITYNLFYKPDLHSILEIFKGDPEKKRPTIYQC